MHQNEELNRVKLRIKALAAKTVEAGCSEHEAYAAATKVGELLAAYNLSMAECDVREAKCVTIKIDTGLYSRGGMDTVAVALGDFADCRVWFSQGSKTWRLENDRYVKERVNSKHAFFGQESDTELVEYLYKVIKSALDFETEAFKLTDEYKSSRRKKAAYVSFQKGFASRVCYRLRQLKRENDEALRRAHEETMSTVKSFWAHASESPLTPREKRAAGVTGTALLVLKKQLVEQEFKVHGPGKLGKHYYRGSIKNDDAYYAGQRAGERVNLSRPIGGSSVGGYLK